MSGGVRKSLSEEVKQPDFEGYQLIGDSQFLRFSESLLNVKRREANGVYRLGFCVSGQRIGDLLRRVQGGLAAVSEKVILMIGTNDLLRDTDLEAMQEDYDRLVNLLRKKAKKIILLTIPPVFKLRDQVDHWNRLKNFNNFVKEYHDGRNIFVGDAYAKFIAPKELPNRNVSVISLNLENSSDSPEPTPAPKLKSILSNRKKPRRPEILLKSSNVDKISVPVQQDCRAPSQLFDQKSSITPMLIGPRSCDSKSSDEDCQQPVAKKSKEVVVFNRLFQNSSKGAVTVPSKRLSADGDTITTSSKMLPRNPRPRSAPSAYSSGGNDSTSPFKRVKPPKEKCNSPITGIKWPSDVNSFSSGGNDSTTQSKKVQPSKEKCNSPITGIRWPSDVNSFSSGGNDSTTPSKRMQPPKEKSNSSITGIKWPSDVCSMSPSNSSLTPKKMRRAEYNQNGNCDTSGTEDEIHVENADSIRGDCFEKYFGGDSRRPDGIHLNRKGLFAIKGILLDTMELVGK